MNGTVGGKGLNGVYRAALAVSLRHGCSGLSFADQTSRKKKEEDMARFKANIIWFLVGTLAGAAGMYLYFRYAVSHLLG